MPITGRSGKSITTIDLSGPFFTHDPAKTFRQNIRVMLEALAAEGEADVKAQIAPHNRTGLTAAGVVGRVKSLEGRPWALTAVISETRVFPWGARGSKGFSGVQTTKAGKSTDRTANAIYRGGKLEGKLHMFRRTTSRLRSSRAVNMAELTKGLE